MIDGGQLMKMQEEWKKKVGQREKEKIGRNKGNVINTLNLSYF